MSMFLYASVAENITEGLLNMVAGLIVVFGVLVFLSLIISCFKYINKFADGGSSAKASAASAPAPVKAAPAPAAAVVPAGPGTMAKTRVSFDDEVEGPVAAAVLAAVAQYCGGNFKVTSIKKHK